VRTRWSHSTTRGARQIQLGEFGLRGPDNFRGEATEDNPSGRYIGAVDNIYTAVPVLWRAHDATGETRFRDVAISHADRHLDWYTRSDGSTMHHAVSDPDTGALLHQYNELAHSDESCWARGQGWNTAGLALAYNATRAERYLRALRKTTIFYVDHSPDDLVPFWDFEDLAIPNAPRDTSAAALRAYGLISLDDGSDSTAELRRTGGEILASLVDGHIVLDATNDRYGMVTHSCYNKPGEYVTSHETIWTDYYVAAAIDASLVHRQRAGRDGAPSRSTLHSRK
jgi:unsaturated chondroitin disaccharide hydrolase